MSGTKVNCDSRNGPVRVANVAEVTLAERRLGPLAYAASLSWLETNPKNAAPIKRSAFARTLGNVTKVKKYCGTAHNCHRSFIRNAHANVVTAGLGRQLA